MDWAFARLCQGLFPKSIARMNRDITRNMESAPFRNRLIAELRRRELKKSELARAAGVKYDIVRDLCRREGASTTVENAKAIAEALGLSLDAMLTGGTGTRPPVAVVGEVGAGAEVQHFDAYAKGDGLFHVPLPPQLEPDSIAAVLVRGDSMVPAWMPGDVLFFTRAAPDGIADEDIGRPCVVADTEGRVWLKQVKRGDEPGLFHLISLNPSAGSVWNQSIKWAARVRFTLPAEDVEAIEPSPDENGGHA